MKHGNGRLLVEAFGYVPYFKHLDKLEFMVLFEIGLMANAMLRIAGERIATAAGAASQ